MMYQETSGNRALLTLRLLYANFFTDEPMSRSLKLTDGVKRDPGAVLQSRTTLVK
jgi:hypothetical protein